MPTSVIPYIPETIVVHLGAPTQSAANVTVPFTDYIKNVVSSEIYPTWEPAALEANTLAIISFALNRFYTEYYRSRGYDFDITSSTAIDQKYIEGRNIYENISVLVDEIFDRYLRREGFVEPLAAKFCNGVTTTCDGLSQWGSQYLAEGGADAFSILRSYYGNVELVTNAPVQEPSPSYPGTPLRRGDTNADVALIQFILNRISQNYPAIPKLTVDGVFGADTEASVRAFQSIFDLTADGIVGPATWYKMLLLYVAVQRLSELQSLGQTYIQSMGVRVKVYHYLLMVLLTLVSVTAMQSVGTILIVAMLITPAATAYLYTNSLWSMMLLSSGLGALASILGLFIGYSLNIAVGSCIVLTSAVFFLISFFIAPKQRKNKHALSSH